MRSGRVNRRYEDATVSQLYFRHWISHGVVSVSPSDGFFRHFSIENEAEVLSGDWEAIRGDLHVALKKATMGSSFNVERTDLKTA